MFTIHLQHLIFSANHGVHEEEKICSGDFEVNVELTLSEPGAQKVDDLSQTADYSVVFQVIQKAMKNPTPLLETLIQQIESDLLEIYPSIESLFIKIDKKNPPILNINGSVAVSFKKNYKVAQ